MSRAKLFDYDGHNVWFDYKHPRATVEQLELLADYEGLDIDDLLDENLSQKQVARRLFEATTHVVPPEVLERRRERERLHGISPACRICTLNGWECEGRITRHHFMPRWLMLELENYQAYAARKLCTIPICVARHRDLHTRDRSDKSIVHYLRISERKFANKMMQELEEQHPKIMGLLLDGDYYAYEYQLARDFRHGLFVKDDNAYSLDEYQLPEAKSLGV